MKHIEKRFLIEKTKEEVAAMKGGRMVNFDQDSINETLAKSKKDHITFLITNEEVAIGAFVYNSHGKKYILPVPTRSNANLFQ